MMENVGSEEELRVAVVVGSVRDGRFGSTVGSWVEKWITGEGGTTGGRVRADIVDLADFSFPRSMSEHQDVGRFAERISDADAVVIITPEYNHSFPGPLKTAIDSVHAQWQAKPVAFVSYGGMAGGLRAVEALRLVFAELHTVTVRDTVSLHNPWGPAADPDTEYPDLAATEALRQMMRQLLWWARALHAARARAPYPG